MGGTEPYTRRPRGYEEEPWWAESGPVGKVLGNILIDTAAFRPVEKYDGVGLVQLEYGESLHSLGKLAEMIGGSTSRREVEHARLRLKQAGFCTFRQEHDCARAKTIYRLTEAWRFVEPPKAGPETDDEPGKTPPKEVEGAKKGQSKSEYNQQHTSWLAEPTGQSRDKVGTNLGQSRDKVGTKTLAMIAPERTELRSSEAHSSMTDSRASESVSPGQSVQIDLGQLQQAATEPQELQGQRVSDSSGMDASDWLELALCCIESCPFRPSDDPGDTEEALAAFLGPWLERHTPPDVLQGILELERPRRLHALWTWWQHEAFLPLMQIDYLAGRPYNERGDCEPAMTLRRFASPIKGDDGHFVRKLLAGDYKKFPKGKARRPELANAEKSASILAYQAGQRNGGFPHDAD